MIQRQHWQRLRPCRLIAAAGNVPGSRPVGSPTVKADGRARCVEVTDSLAKDGSMGCHDSVMSACYSDLMRLTGRRSFASRQLETSRLSIVERANV